MSEGITEDGPIIIEEGLYPKIVRAGRPPGTGCNQILLGRIRVDDPSSYLLCRSKRRMKSIRVSANQQKIPIKVRRLAEGGYAIWRITPIQGTKMVVE